MFYVNSHKKLYKPLPAVIWSIHPTSQIITIRPAWDPYTKLILPKELDQYYSYPHMLSLAKLLKSVRFYPEGTKYVAVVRRALAFFRQGYFIYLGENVLIDPWGNDEPLAAINYVDPFHEYNEPLKFYGN